MSSDISKSFRAVTFIVTALLFLIFAAGCTDIERRGYSPIPQNSPGAWEVNPYNF